MKRTVSRAVLEAPGAWTHRVITAGGTSFHVADCGPDSSEYAVILLHPFPLTWWTWRKFMPRMAEAGVRTIAMDIRGFGTSDLAPGDVDIRQLADDVTAVASTLGVRTFSVVGCGMGGVIAWMLGAQSPSSLRGIVTVCAPHPLGVSFPFRPGRRGRLLTSMVTRRPKLSFSLSRTPWVDRVIQLWAAPSSVRRLLASATPYRAALSRPFAAGAAWETLRAVHRPSPEAQQLLERPVEVPVLSVQCDSDGLWSPVDYAQDSERTCGPWSAVVLRNCGHFPQEESCEELAAAVTPFLRECIH